MRPAGRPPADLANPARVGRRRRPFSEISRFDTGSNSGADSEWHSPKSGKCAPRAADGCHQAENPPPEVVDRCRPAENPPPDGGDTRRQGDNPPHAMYLTHDFERRHSPSLQDTMSLDRHALCRGEIAPGEAHSTSIAVGNSRGDLSCIVSPQQFLLPIATAHHAALALYRQMHHSLLPERTSCCSQQVVRGRALTGGRAPIASIAGMCEVVQRAHGERSARHVRARAKPLRTRP